MKAIDFWVGGCYCTVFSALSEYCVVLYLVKKAEWERKVQKHNKAIRDRRSTNVNPALDRAKQPKVSPHEFHES